MRSNPYKEIREKSGLKVGMEVKIKTNSKGKKVNTTKGEIVSIPNHSNFVVNNGMWNESFCFRDIGRPGGITVTVL